MPGWYPTQLLTSTLVLLSFGTLRGLVYMTRYYISGAVSQVFSTLQRQRVLEYALKYTEGISTGEVVSIFSDRVSRAAEVLYGVSQLIISVTSCLLFFIYGTKKAPLEMFMGVFSIIILLLPFKRFNSIIANSGDGLRKEWSNVNQILIQGLNNHFFFKIYNLIDVEISKAKKYLDEYDSHVLRYYKASSVKNHSPNIIGIFIVCVISFISVRFIHTRPIILLSFFYIFIRFTQGLSEMHSVMSSLKLNYKTLTELYYFHQKLDLANAQTAQLKRLEKKEVTVNPFGNGVSIDVKGLTFGFPKFPLLFTNIGFTLKTGEVLLIKGPSGVGKSTLLMLILGYLKPLEGNIVFNNYDVSQVLPLWSEIVGYVGPEPYMTVGTIKENLLFGNQRPHELTDHDLLNAMNLAQLDIIQFPLDFPVGELSTLSTGQKQRLSIARAILRRPKLLILDEATANLDNETEKNFITSIDSLLHQVATIIISHKTSFDYIATHTVILEKSHVS